MTTRKRVLIPGFFVRIIFPFVGLLLAPALRAQSTLDLPEQLTADIVDTKGLNQTLAGNVKLRYRGVVLFCDQAVHNVSAHSVNAYGHILIVQGDSITARGDSARFAYSDRHLLLYGRVMFQDHKTTLTTAQLDYDLAAGVVTYNQKGRIVDEKAVLTSLKGTYNIQLKQFVCQQSVQLATRKTTVKAESLVYNTGPQRSATLPRVISPTITEQRVVESKPVQQVAVVIAPAVATHRPVAEPVAILAAMPVAKPMATSTLANRQSVSATKAKPVFTAATDSPKRTSAVVETMSAPIQPSGTFSPAVYSASTPTFRQAVHSTPANPHTVDLSDLERELNKKKRFH
jgi:lipopolysaccharide export system protein LptA